MATHAHRHRPPTDHPPAAAGRGRACGARTVPGAICAAALAVAAGPSAHGQLATAESSEYSDPPPALPGHSREARGGPDRPHEHPAPGSRAATDEPGPSEAPALRDWIGGRPWPEWDHALGDVAGVRTALEEAGLSVHASYILDWSTVFTGGVRRTAATDSIFDFAVEADLERMLGLAGASAFLNFYSTDGRGQGRAGDFQGWSNIETAENDDQIGELWFQQELLDGRLRLKFGKIEANSEFMFVESAGEFLNSSGGFSPTSGFLPTYPDPAMGLVAFLRPTDRLYLGAGVFDGAAGDGFRTGPSGPATFFSDDRSSDWFIIAEAGVRWDALPLVDAGEAALRRGRAAIGGWLQTGTLERFDGSTDAGTRGLYLLIEQQLWARHPAAAGASGQAAEGADRGLWMFAQFGRSDDRVVEAGTHVGVGLSLLGTFGGRDDDAAGVYWSWVDLSDDPDAGFAEDESVLELFYKLQITPWISVKPDVQIIWNPGGDPNVDTAVVGAIRFEIVF